MAKERSIWEGTLGAKFSGLACVGRILAVDQKSRTCRVQTLGAPGVTDDLNLSDVKILHNAWHPQGDEETYIPRTNSYCLIIFAESQPYIVGYVPLEFEDGSAVPNTDKNKEALQPGDKTIATVAKNRLTLRSGGAVTLQSTLHCRTFWLPSKNIINSVCENYELETNGGKLYWTTVEEEETDLPKGSTRLNLLAIDNVIKPTKAARLQLGTAEDTKSPLKFDLGSIDGKLNLETTPGIALEGKAEGETSLILKKKSYKQVGPFGKTNASGQTIIAPGNEKKFYAETVDAEKLTYSLDTPAGHHITLNDAANASSIKITHSTGTLVEIDKDGFITLRTKSKSEITVKEDITLTDAAGKQILKLSKDGVSINAEKEVNVTAPTVNVSAKDITLGEGASFHGVIYESLAKLFDQHMHATAMGPSGPPLPPNTFALTESSPAQSAKAGHIKVIGN